MNKFSPCWFTLMWSQLIGIIRGSKRSVQKPNNHLERREDKRRGMKMKKEEGILLDLSPSRASVLFLAPHPQPSIFHLWSNITCSILGQWLGERHQHNHQSQGTQQDAAQSLQPTNCIFIQQNIQENSCKFKEREKWIAGPVPGHHVAAVTHDS